MTTTRNIRTNTRGRVPAAQLTLDPFIMSMDTQNPLSLEAKFEKEYQERKAKREKVFQKIKEDGDKAAMKRAFQKVVRGAEKADIKGKNFDPKAFTELVNKHPERKWSINVEDVWFTLTPQNIAKVIKRFEAVKEGTGGQEGYDEYDDDVATEAKYKKATSAAESGSKVSISSFVPSSQRSSGAFFKHINLTSFDLSRYGIYRSESEIETDDNCLFMALKQGGFPEERLDELRFTLQVRDIPEYKVKDVCEKFRIQVRLSKKGRTIVYGKEGPIHNIGLLDSHYFINDTTEITTFAIKNYEELKEVPKFNLIVGKDGNKWKRDTRKCAKAFHIIETLMETKGLLRPIEYCNDLLRTPFHSKFKKRKGIVLNQVSDEDIHSPKKKKAKKITNKLRFFIDFETDTSIKDPNAKNKNKAKHESYGVSVHFDDRETNYLGRKEGKLYKAWFEDEVKIDEKTGEPELDWDTGEPRILHHAEAALRWICRKYREITNNARNGDCEMLLLAHNLTYDIRFLMDRIMCTSILQKGSKTLTAKCFRNHLGHKVPFTLKDTACMIPKKLVEFGKMFGLETEKEVLPYALYTKKNIEKRRCTVKEANKVFDRTGCKDQKPQFLENLKKLGLLSDNGKSDNGKSDDHKYDDHTFDIMEYSKFYCQKDTEVLCQGYMKFREWILESFEIDIDNQVTISSVARTYLQNRGCFKGVKNLGGVLRAFVQQCVVGGRVMTRENKKVHAKGPISDYDAVSLYPSAMSRLNGFLLGAPKLIEEDQKNLEFLNKVDGYFVHARIDKVGIQRSFPLMSEFSDTGSRMFENEVEEVYLDKIGLEDLINFQKCEVTVLDGVYFNEGRNNKLKEVIEEMFELRAKKKKEENPIQEVFKLILNSAYGYTLMKAPEHDIQLKNKGEFDIYLQRNYNHIHSYVYVGTNKVACKTHKAIDEHNVPIHCGVEVLSMSKRIMNEVMCLAEDIDIPIYYQDTDSMHLPEDKVPGLEKTFKEKYGRDLHGEELGQFHTDFDFMDTKGEKLKEYKNIRSLELIALGKKAYLDVLEATKDGVTKQSLHIRQKGVPTECVEYTAHGGELSWDNPERISSVKDLYLRMLGGKAVDFDLTQNGTRTKFDTRRDFTVYSRPDFTRKVSFKSKEILYYGEH